MHYIALQRRKILLEREELGLARAYVQTSDGIGLSDSYESRENDYKTIGDKKIITPPHALFTCLPIYGGIQRFHSYDKAQDGTTRFFRLDFCFIMNSRGDRPTILLLLLSSEN